MTHVELIETVKKDYLEEFNSDSYGMTDFRKGMIYAFDYLLKLMKGVDVDTKGLYTDINETFIAKYQGRQIGIYDTFIEAKLAVVEFLDNLPEVKEFTLLGDKICIEDYDGNDFIEKVIMVTE